MHGSSTAQWIAAISAVVAIVGAIVTILVYPNMLEGLAGMYNHGLLDRKIIKTHVESEAQDLWSIADWWIDELRSESDGNVYRDIEVMLQDLAKRDPPAWYHQEN